MQSLPSGYQALILGASGAIGGAIAAQLQADPRCTQVLALSRQSTPAIDFDQPDSIATAAHALRAQGPWHLIVVATGMLTGPTGGPEKRLTELNATHLAGRLLGEAISGRESGRFDLFAQVPHITFPGGKHLRSPLLALGMLWHRFKALV